MRKRRLVIRTAFVLVVAVMALSGNSCQLQKKVLAQNTETYEKISPDFNADSAYAFIEKQVSFGPRVPNTAQHTACGDYLVETLTRFGAEVTEQKADITHYDGRNLPIRNIIGSYFPEKEKRVLLFAHWDTRPFADYETDVARKQQPILGADDGASGVGVLLEIARQLQQSPVDVGVDIVFFDLEDWGQPDFSDSFVPGEWWCLGSQYWSEHPHVADYKASYGILLDMVGAANATFLKEGLSVEKASNIVEKVWSTASKLGYGKYFIAKKYGYITDDHVYVNQHRRAPSINIINLKDTPTGFAPHWHTLSDDMRNIDRNTLKAVGQTVMEVVYLEK